MIQLNDDNIVVWMHQWYTELKYECFNDQQYYGIYKDIETNVALKTMLKVNS
jgi:hypothetical protein